MRRYAIIIVIMLSAVVWVGLAIAQSGSVTPVPYVYRIDSKGCTFEPTNRRQTGFRVQGLTGIVTALHGVADCKTISAVADGGQELFNDLKIQQVDIARDVALLAAPELEDLPNDGLLPSPLTDAEILTTTLRIVGYPRGLEKQDVDVIESIRNIESLDDVIPDEEEPADFIKRKSPSLTIDVLNVQAQLLPGHSGAPLIDSTDQIVAIGNGGLRGGTEGRSWAIPWSAVELQAVDSVEIQQKLAELAEKDIVALAFSSTYPNQLTDETKLVTYAVRVVDTNQTPIANAEVLLTHSAGYMIGITDSEGFYTFQLPTNASYIQSQIQVEAPGYPAYSRTLSNVLDKVGTEILRLNALRPTSNPISGSICEFAFRILDETSEQPITGATVSVTLGTSPSLGRTDSTGYFGSKLPCVDSLGANIKVRITATGYKVHSETVLLVDETKEIWLIPLLSPTETPTSASTFQLIPPADLRVVDDGLTINTYLIEGNDYARFDIGDDLVVYAEPIPGTEVAIALLKVIGKSPNSLTAQAILVDQETEIRARMRVDDQLTFISQSRLVPVFDYVDGYLLREGRVWLRREHGLTVGAQLQALEFERISGEIVDALRTDTIMQITSMGVDGQVAAVALITGTWPVTGTIVSLVEVPTPSSSLTQPTGTMTATPQSTVTATTQIEKPSCQVVGIFSSIWYANREKLGCNTSEVITSPITYEPFEGGYLVWSKLSDLIYVLPEGAYWLQQTNSWNPNENSLPCNQAQQFGYPAMGFGKLWCTNEKVRIALGNPLGEELPNEFAQQQNFAGGFVFEILGGRRIILFKDGTWSIN